MLAYILPQQSKYLHSKFHLNRCSGLAMEALQTVTFEFIALVRILKNENIALHLNSERSVNNVRLSLRMQRKPQTN